MVIQPVFELSQAQDRSALRGTNQGLGHLAVHWREAGLPLGSRDARISCLQGRVKGEGRPFLRER